MKKRFNPQRKYPPFLGVFFAISATLFLSIKPIIIKVIYEHGVTPEDALYIRQVIAAVVLSLLFLCSPKNRLLVKSRKMGIYLLLIGFFGFFLSPLLDFWGLVYVSAVLERMLLFTYPVFVILITALLNKWKIRVWTCVFFFIIYIGLFFALSGGNLSILKMNMFGGTLILLSAFTYAIYLVLASKVLTKTGVINVNAIGMVVSVLFLSIYLGGHVLRGGTSAIFSLSPTVSIYLFFLSLFTTVFPLLFTMESIKRIGVERTSVISMAGPIVTIVLSYLFLQETLNWIQWVGCLLVFLAIMVLQFKKTVYVT